MAMKAPTTRPARRRKTARRQKRQRRSVAMLTPLAADAVEKLRDLCIQGQDHDNPDPTARFLWLSKILRQSEAVHRVIRDLIVRDNDHGRTIENQTLQLALAAGINACANLGALLAGDEIDGVARPRVVDLDSYSLAVTSMALQLDRRILALTIEDVTAVEAAPVKVVSDDD